MAPIDRFRTTSPENQTFRRSFLMEASEQDAPEVAKAICVTTPGRLRFIPADNADDEIVTLTLTATKLIPIQVRRVVGGTTATVWGMVD